MNTTMPPDTPRSRENLEQGLTLTEVLIASTVMVTAVVALAAVMLPVSQQTAEIQTNSAVIREARSLLEEIKGVDPEFVEATYEGRTYKVPTIEGGNDDGTALTVSVDSTNPKLLRITVLGSWVVSGNLRSLTIETSVYYRDG